MNHNRRRNRRKSEPKRAVTLAAVLACLLVVLLFTSAVVQSLVMHQRASKWDEQQLQCLFLIESAVDRAKAKCALDPSYSGEDWSPSLDDRGVSRMAQARIQVEPVANEPRQRRVSIETRWPDDPISRVQRTKELTITLPASGAAS